jgi:hypothetical protein
VARTFYRLVRTDPPRPDDFLPQAALRRPPPRQDPKFLRAWEGLSVFDDAEALRQLAMALKWRMGEFIATLHVPDDAPILYKGPEKKGTGHWLLYAADGAMLTEEHAPLLLGWVVRVVHGPSTGD